MIQPDTRSDLNPYFTTDIGSIYLADSLEVMKSMDDSSVDLIMTSPPFGLIKKKEYGNADSDEYLDWFRPFASEMHRILKDSGSLVIDIGGAWNPGQPTRSLYHFKLMIMLCEEYGFNLAQEFFWWNPSKLPSPAEWVNIRRIRVKDAVNTVWWLSKTPWPKASNTRILQPYSDSMEKLLKDGYTPKKRPSGHDISTHFSVNNGGSIPPNLLAIANTESNGSYDRYCKEHGLVIHPARFPSQLPEFFMRMLTDAGDLVLDPFAGSCMTGEVAEKLSRKWVCCEMVEDYVKGAEGRFTESKGLSKVDGQTYYRIPKVDVLWNNVDVPLPQDGGKSRPQKKTADSEKKEDE